MYHQLGHARFLVTRRRQIEVADDGLAGGGHDQMIGAVMGEFPQHLLTDRCYPVEFCCGGD